MAVHRELLGDVKVLDLSQYVPGPFATRQLADLGANVIKIEPPSGDPMRRFMHQSDDQVSPIYRHLNRGKRICLLDLKADQGRETLANLLVDADILLESYRPGVLERLGFGRTRLDQINPGLIHCALSGYGQTGPYQSSGGHDLNYLASSGILAVSGTEDKPVMSYPPLDDHASSMQACSMILAALYAREKKRKGVYLDISMFECCLSWNYLPILADSQSRAADMLNGGAACYNIYRCADGSFVSLGALEAHFWERFCIAVERSEWIERHDDTLPQRSLITELNRLFSSQPIKFWNQLLGRLDCCYEPVLLISELEQHPQIQARGMLNSKGPAYPGKIDDHSIEIDDNFIEINVASSPHW